MKRLLSFLFVLFMCSSSSSQTVQNVVGLWTVMNDSTVFAGIRFEENGKFEYIGSFDPVNYVNKKGTWECSDTHRITLVVRKIETRAWTQYFKTLEAKYSFMLDKKKSAGFFGNEPDRMFKKIDLDFSTKEKEDEKSPQKVLAKKGIVI